MALDLSKLQASVTAIQGSVQSAVTLLTSLDAALKAAGDPAIQAQVDSLQGAIDTATSTLNAAVTANTPTS